MRLHSGLSVTKKKRDTSVFFYLTYKAIHPICFKFVTVFFLSVKDGFIGSILYSLVSPVMNSHSAHPEVSVKRNLRRWGMSLMLFLVYS